MKTVLRLLCFFLFTPAVLNAGGAKTPLSKEMEAIAKNMRQLERQVGNPSKQDSSLQLIQVILKSAQTSKTLVPAKAKTVPKNEQAKFVADYQQGMDSLIAQLTKLETATRSGNTSEATRIMAGFRGIKRGNHEKFSSED